MSTFHEKFICNKSFTMEMSLFTQMSLPTPSERHYGQQMRASASWLKDPHRVCGYQDIPSSLRKYETKEKIEEILYNTPPRHMGAWYGKPGITTRDKITLKMDQQSQETLQTLFKFNSY